MELNASLNADLIVRSTIAADMAGTLIPATVGVRGVRIASPNAMTGTGIPANVDRNVLSVNVIHQDRPAASTGTKLNANAKIRPRGGVVQRSTPIARYGTISTATVLCATTNPLIARTGTMKTASVRRARRRSLLIARSGMMKAASVRSARPNPLVAINGTPNIAHAVAKLPRVELPQIVLPRLVLPKVELPQIVLPRVVLRQIVLLRVVRVLIRGLELAGVVLL